MGPLENYLKMSAMLKRVKVEKYLVTLCFYSFIHSCIPSSPHSLYSYLFSYKCLSGTVLSPGGEARMRHNPRVQRLNLAEEGTQMITEQ